MTIQQLHNQIISNKFLIKKKLIKDNFEFNIFFNDSKIYDNLIDFLSFDYSKNEEDKETTSFYFINKNQLQENLDLLLMSSIITKVHGGTPQQHVYANKKQEGPFVLYKINDGKTQYIIQNNETDEYILIGDENTLSLDLLRIIREVYYRKSLSLNRIAIHSAAIVSPNNDCILIPGNKGSGKTTILCNFLTKSKFGFLDNDRIMVNINENDMIAHSMSSTVNLAYGTLKNYKNLLDIPTINNDSNKIKLSKFEFINLLNCNFYTKGKIKGIIFPSIDKNIKHFYTEHIHNDKIFDLFEQFIEKEDNMEHPNWLNISSKLQNKKTDNCIQNALNNVEAYKLYYGYELIDTEDLNKISEKILKKKV